MVRVEICIDKLIKDMIYAKTVLKLLPGNIFYYILRVWK